MISVEEALKIIHSHSKDFGSEQIPFIEAHGRVLDEDIYSDRDFPPYNRAAMDGIAISYGDWENGMRSFPITGEQFAGSPKQKLTTGTCMEIMTGAVVPEGADTVIRYEDVSISNQNAQVTVDEITALQSVVTQGTDAKAGSLIIAKGKKLSHGDVGILSSVGKTKVLVKKLPKVAIISTGDELVEPDQTPEPHQIRKSNVYTLCSLLTVQKLTYQSFHIDDDEQAIDIALPKILQDFDLVLLSGGVSKGKRDYVPEALEKHGITKHFHRIKQRPGKPLWFGSNENTTVFGFPGNPVSTVACFTVYCLSWLTHSLGLEIQENKAVLTDTIHFGKELTYFVHVSLINVNGQLQAKSLRGNGSGDLVSLSEADGFIELPSDKTEFKKGEEYKIHLFD